MMFRAGREGLVRYTSVQVNISTPVVEQQKMAENEVQVK